MARERSSGAAVLLALLALALFVLGVSGKAGPLLTKLVEWLTGTALAKTAVKAAVKKKSKKPPDKGSGTTVSDTAKKALQNTMKQASKWGQDPQKAQIDPTNPGVGLAGGLMGAVRAGVVPVVP